MRFYRMDEEPLAGYFGEGEQMGYFAEEPEELGYVCDYDDLEGVGYVGQEYEDEMGAFAEDEFGYVAADDLEDYPQEVGYTADPPPGFTEGCPPGIAYVAEDPDFGVMGYVGEDEDEALDDAEEFYEVPEALSDYEEEMGCFGEEEDEEFGYMADDDDELGQGYEYEMDGFDDDPEGVEGYVREAEPAFNTRVMPVNTVNGVEGYQRPKMVNPTCEKLRPAEEVSRPASGWFQPLW